MAESIIKLRIRLDVGLGTVSDEVMGLAQSLRNDLLELDVRTVEPAEVPSLDKSKSGLVIDWTTLFVAFVASGGLITTIISTIQSWLMRNQASNITLKIGEDAITISGAGPYSKQQEAAIQLWLKRHKNIMVPQ